MDGAGFLNRARGAGAALAVAVAALVSCAGRDAAPPAHEAAAMPEPRSALSSDWRAESDAARKAREAGDWAAYRAHVVRLRELLPEQPELLVRLAVAEARLGRNDAALAALRDYVAMGLVFDLDRDPDLAVLRALPGIAPIARRLAQNAEQVGHVSVALRLREPDLLVEDVTVDPATRVRYLSSVRKGKIVAVDPDGTQRDFGAPFPGLSVLGLGVDGARRRLFASVAAMPQREGRANDAGAGATALVAIDLDTAKVVARYELPAGEAGEHAFADVSVAEGRGVFVADGLGGGVYELTGERLVRLDVPGTIRSPQTPALAADGRRLYVPDYAYGLRVLERAPGGRVTSLEHPKDLAANGIDGLYLAGDTLFGMQNGTKPPRVIAMRLDPSGARIVRWSVIEASTPTLGDPTHGVILGDELLFIANSGWDVLDDDGALRPGKAFTPAELHSACIHCMR